MEKATVPHHLRDASLPPAILVPPLVLQTPHKLQPLNSYYLAQEEVSRTIVGSVLSRHCQMLHQLFIFLTINFHWLTPSRMRKLEGNLRLGWDNIPEGKNTDWKYHDAHVIMSCRLTHPQSRLPSEEWVTHRHWFGEMQEGTVDSQFLSDGNQAAATSKPGSRKELPIAQCSLWTGPPDPALPNHPASSGGNTLQWEKLGLMVKI